MIADSLKEFALTSAIQALVILVIALALGVHVHEGFLGWIVALVGAMAVTMPFAAISQGIALLTRREATMIAVADFIGLPLLFLSSTLLATTQMPHRMQIASRFNPLNWGVIAARQAVLPGTDWGSIGAHLGYLAALTVVTTAFATWTFRAYQRTL